MKLLLQTEYLYSLLASLREAKHSITLATMLIDAAGGMEKVMDELDAAAKRGVKITLYVDVFTHIHFLTERHPIQEYYETQTVRKRLQTLEANGVDIKWLSSVDLNPFKHRFHQKISVIDDKEVYFAGGINLTGISFHVRDFMLHETNTELAAKLSVMLSRITEEQSIPSQSFALDAQHTILIDGGQQASSIIYDKVVELTKEARSILFVSQMAPSGKLAKVLRHKKVTYYLNSPFSMSLISGVSEFLTQQRYQYHNSYCGKEYIHAKYMLFTMSNGEKLVVTGSHNFNERGVRYKTKEIALLAKDEALWDELYNYAMSLC